MKSAAPVSTSETRFDSEYMIRVRSAVQVELYHSIWETV